LSDVGRFRCEQRFGGLARSGDLLAVIAAMMRIVLSRKQDLLRTVSELKSKMDSSALARG
jgi:hypothetical protein